MVRVLVFRKEILVSSSSWV